MLIIIFSYFLYIVLFHYALMTLQENNVTKLNSKLNNTLLFFKLIFIDFCDIRKIKIQI